MIEALLYFFAPQPEASTPNAATEAETAVGGRLEIEVTGNVKFHHFHDTAFFECRPQFMKGPFNTVTR